MQALTENPPGPNRLERINAWFDGYTAGLTDYATWKDGVQYTAMGRAVPNELPAIEATRIAVRMELAP